MLRRFTDGPRYLRIVGHTLLDPDGRKVARPHTLGPQPCERELAIELGIDRRDIGCRVERREAVGRVPATAQASCAFATESAVDGSIVSIHEARVRAPLQAVERLVEPAGFPLGYAKTPSPSPSIRVRTRRYSPDRTRSTGRP